MNAKLLRDFLDWPTDQQEELIGMTEELDRHREESQLYRAQLAKHYAEITARVPWWRRKAMEFGAWLHGWAMPKWMTGYLEGR